MTVPGGGCRSLGCHGYLRSLLEACISPANTIRCYSHLARAHLLATTLMRAWLTIPVAYALGSQASSEIINRVFFFFDFPWSHTVEQNLNAMTISTSRRNTFQRKSPSNLPEVTSSKSLVTA